MSQSILIYDAEIRHGIATADNPQLPGFRYARGWTDFAGMGIAVICAYDTLEARYRVFMEDNLSDLVETMYSRDMVIGFNNWRFDDRLLFANGIEPPAGKTKDLAAAIWHAAGIPNGEHPRGLGLNAICKANGIPGKTGNGADAPQWFQRGRIGRVVDYCLGDVRSTLLVLRRIQADGGIIDPRNGEWLTVRI